MRRTLIALSLLIASLALLAAAPQNAAKPDAADAARLNNLGVAYMNQQLLKRAECFEQAAAADPNFQTAQINAASPCSTCSAWMTRNRFSKPLQARPEGSACLVQPGPALQEF
jgi:Tfp pilus assembly protein PilF